MVAYYNELDPFAAQTLRNLIDAGQIAPGDVDERSIEDVCPDDLRNYTQCHFFAGIGVWSLALRNAGWDDDTRVWTGSCPCQPFSTAGEGLGFADERHLWPAWFHLITQCEPPVVFGEQVASKSVNKWIDLVQDDMEALGYRVGAVAFPAASVGAPHVRDRTYWVADSSYVRQSRSGEMGRSSDTTSDEVGEVCGAFNDCGSGRVADSSSAQRETEWVPSGVPEINNSTRGYSTCSGLEQTIESKKHSGRYRERWSYTDNPFWGNSDWLFSRDGKWRAVEPGTFPLAHGTPKSVGALDAWVRGMAEMAGLDDYSIRRAREYRVGALRAYGNAINAVQAEQFIRAYMYA